MVELLKNKILSLPEQEFKIERQWLDHLPSMAEINDPFFINEN